MSDELAQWIEQEISERGWSIRELASRAELAPTTINDVVNGKTKPGVQFCNGVARALKTPPERVFRLAGLLPPLIIGGDGKEDEEELLSYYRTLSSADRRTANALVRTLYENREEYKAKE